MNNVWNLGKYLRNSQDLGCKQCQYLKTSRGVIDKYSCKKKIPSRKDFQFYMAGISVQSCDQNPYLIKSSPCYSSQIYDS